MGQVILHTTHSPKQCGTITLIFFEKQTHTHRGERERGSTLLKKLNQQSTIKYNHSTKFKFKSNQTLTMETILIITKKEMFSDSSRNYIRNKVRKFKNPFFDISFNLI